MPTKDCRVDYIKDYVFTKESTVQLDQQLNLETIRLCSYLHVTSLTPDLLCAIYEKCQLIKCLQFDSIVGNLNSIWSLDVDHQYGSNLDFQGDRIKSLDKLNGLKILICPYNVDESNLSLLLANCPNLETYIICFAREGEPNHGISGKCFNYLGNKIKHLLLGNLVIKNETINYILNSNGHSVQEIEILSPLRESQFNSVLKLQNLRKLTFKACYCSYEQILHISTFSDLESLEIERLEFLNDTLEELFSPVFQKCRKLKQFKVSGVFRLYSRRLFTMIEENNLQLTHLHIHPNMYRRELKQLQISISDSIDSLCALKKLKSLSLPYSDLTDDHLQLLLTSCPNLTIIDLSYCQSITSTDYIVTHAQQNLHQNYSIILQSTRIKCLPKLPDNLKLCVCDCERLNSLPLMLTSFYELI